MEIEQNKNLNFFHTAIIGGGPAGTGILMKVFKDGSAESFFEKKIAIIEKTSDLLIGSLPQYQVNSDTFSEVFLECLDGETGNYINIKSLKKEIKEICKYKGQPIPLNKLSTYFNKLGSELYQTLIKYENCKLFLNTTAGGIIIREDGTFLINFLNSSEKVVAKRLIIATGGNKYFTKKLYFADKLPLKNYLHKIIHSDVLLKDSFPVQIKTKKKLKIVILGGSHSAFSSAVYLLKHKSNFSAGAIKIWCKEAPSLFFPSQDEAIASGYTNFTSDDICPVTKRVFRLGGLRIDGRELYMKMLGLGGSKLEERVVLEVFNNRKKELTDDLLQADFIILAYGYKFNMIPVYDYNLKPVSLLGEKTGHWVNHECELLDENNSSIRNLYAMGLATGFIPSGELGGEPSFQKQTNGFWYYQNALADFILKKIDEETPEVTS